jgi:hypothetical protein
MRLAAPPSSWEVLLMLEDLKLWIGILSAITQVILILILWLFPYKKTRRRKRPGGRQPPGPPLRQTKTRGDKALEKILSP